MLAPCLQEERQETSDRTKYIMRRIRFLMPSIRRANAHIEGVERGVFRQRDSDVAEAGLVFHLLVTPGPFGVAQAQHHNGVKYQEVQAAQNKTV